MHLHAKSSTHTHTHIFSTGHRDCINTLVGSGADVNAKDKKLYTPLHSAAAGGQPHAVKLLLELGADVSLINYYETLCAKYYRYSELEIRIQSCHNTFIIPFLLFPPLPAI